MNTPRLSIIPALAATDAHIKPRDLQLLCVLGRHTDDGGWCRRSQVKMSREMGCSRATVYNAVERLVKRGYLERHIIETESGRDSAHLYRVVLDPDLEDLSTVQPEETVAESEADPPCHYSGTPASILAPPASPGVAPPASSGVAPMLTTPLNDPLLTEREGAGGREQGPVEEKPVVTKDTWRRRLRKAHADWPTYAADSPQKTEVEWFRLSEEDRDTAVSHLGAYIQHVGGLGRSRMCAFSVYLQEKRWQKLPEQAAGLSGAATMAKPFGKLWGAMRLADLAREPYGAFPRPSPFLQKLLAEGGPQADQERLERRARYGWPKVNTMHEQATRKHHGVTGDPALEPLAALFGKVHKGSAIWIAWQALHRKRGWPWLGEDRYLPEWIWMPDPPDSPDSYASSFEAVRAALARFENEHTNLTRHEAAQ